MRVIACNLMAAMLLVHAMVGCCRYHRHETAHRDGAAADERLAAGCCHHGDGCCGHEEQPSPAPCDCRMECKALCIYLPPERCVTDAGDLSRAMDVVCALDMLGLRTAVEAAAAKPIGDRAWAHTALEPPVRLHLLHQIILA